MNDDIEQKKKKEKNDLNGQNEGKNRSALFIISSQRYTHIFTLSF